MSKRWHFNPYHQRIDEALEKCPTPPEADTEWELFEVFVRERRGDHPVHVGSLHAPDHEMALVLAKEQYLRRGRGVQIWVAPSRCIAATPNKSYREAYGYKVAETVRKIRQKLKSHA